MQESKIKLNKNNTKLNKNNTKLNKCLHYGDNSSCPTNIRHNLAGGLLKNLMVHLDSSLI